MIKIETAIGLLAISILAVVSIARYIGYGNSYPIGISLIIILFIFIIGFSVIIIDDIKTIYSDRKKKHF